MKDLFILIRASLFLFTTTSLLMIEAGLSVAQLSLGWASGGSSD